MSEKIKHFLKNETVLAISGILAVISCFLVPPDAEYAGYINIHTILTLFCLMAVMAGMKNLGLFQTIGETLLKKISSERGLVLILVFLCFVSSMFITNDVALITFVPLAILVLKMADLESAMCFTVTFMTIAANLGSMLTPVGNPQNLYLYSVSQMSIGSFLLLMLPCTLLSALLLIAGICLKFKSTGVSVHLADASPTPDRKKLLYYLLLFLLCLLCVADVLSVEVLFVIIVIAVLLENRRLLLQVDYSLLATFVCFFIFIGNMGRFPVFRDFIIGILEGHERIVAVGISQVISNVPAALLLSGFTSQWSELIIGTNLGGLGTLIASMASLISYKQVAQNYPASKTKYLITFTVWNILFLAILLPVSDIPFPLS